VIFLTNVMYQSLFLTLSIFLNSGMKTKCLFGQGTLRRLEKLVTLVLNTQNLFANLNMIFPKLINSDMTKVLFWMLPIIIKN